eukprot:7377023-Prymnesium_polylepis.2
MRKNNRPLCRRRRLLRSDAGPPARRDSAAALSVRDFARVCRRHCTMCPAARGPIHVSYFVTQLRRTIGIG